MKCLGSEGEGSACSRCSSPSMFGEEQMSVLADYVSAALMLRYNKRAVG